ncbi:CPBP family intramembrane glutamic endopeptidase [Clostridium estertheticum]|uniref:CPBP family intramembrane glutamic endopeptidase n=1 Tax=Clostridium estertheticum TaxID=238834 RepID=UPI001CF13B03|nr:type II CAAX endopeptidase family protein [Clostridium estertheticum]MCB2361704.1 CPBP family intramembrane metalloprotease [Clostridium estertheticum]
MASFISIIVVVFVWHVITLIGNQFGVKLYDNVQICILISVYFVIKRSNNGRFRFDFIGMKFKKNSFNQLFIGIGIGMLLYFAWILILSSMKIIKFKGLGFMLYPANKVLINTVSAFAISILAALAEETLLRGIVLNQLMQFKGEIFAIIISSLIFAMCHFQYYQQFNCLFEVFIMGFLYGYLYIITGSLFMSIGVHFAVDFYLIMSGVSNKLLLFIWKINNTDVSLYLSYVQIVVTLILILVLVLYRYKNRKIGVDIEI